MKRILRILVAGLLPVMFLGCGNETTVIHQSSKTVVVDLEAVAKALDWDSHIAGRVEETTQNLNAQLVQAAESMEAELKQHQASVGPNPTPEQVAALKQAQTRVQQNIQNNKQLAEQAREAVRNEQILLFRKMVKPVAARVAQKHDADMVLISNEDLVWFASSVDITGELITEMRAAALKEEDAVPSASSTPGSGSSSAVTNISSNPSSVETTPAAEELSHDNGH